MKKVRKPWLSFWKRTSVQTPNITTNSVSPVPPGTAISIRNLNKTFSSSWWSWKKQSVVAIEDLSLDIPKSGIFVLLGSNGFVSMLSLGVWLGYFEKY